MYAKKKWPKILIFLVLALTTYNVLPTVFYYAQPLNQPLSAQKGLAVAQAMDRRLADVEEDSLHWVQSLATLLHITPPILSSLPDNPEILSLSFATESDAHHFRAKLPRASSFTVFPLLGCTVLDVEGPPTTVWLERKAPAPFGSKTLPSLLSFQDQIDPVAQDRLTAIHARLMESHGATLFLHLQRPGQTLRNEDIRFLALQLLPWAQLAHDSPFLQHSIAAYFAQQIGASRQETIQSLIPLFADNPEWAPVQELLRSVLLCKELKGAIEHPLFAMPYLKEKALCLPLQPEVALLHAQGGIGQVLMDELSYLSRETREEFAFNGSCFTTTLLENPEASRFLVLDLEKVAQQELSKIAATLHALWHPSHPDLVSSNFPIVTQKEFLALPEEDRVFCLCATTAADLTQEQPGSHKDSLYLKIKGLDRLIQEQSSPELSALLEKDLASLSALLKGLRFTPTFSATQDLLFARAHFYDPLLTTSREAWIVRGSQIYAVLECGSLEARILRENQIDTALHNELLRWQDEFLAAQVQPNPALRPEIPSPSTHPFWSNLKLSATKYIRGDERKILRWGLDLSGGKSVEIALRDTNQLPIVDDLKIQQGMEELALRINKMSLAEIAVRQIGHHIVVDFPSSLAESATDLIQPSSMRFHLVHEKFSLLNPTLAPHVQRFLEEVWNEAVATQCTDPTHIRQIAWNHLQGASPRSESARVLAQEGLSLAHPTLMMEDSLKEDLSQVAVWRGTDARDWHGQSHPLLIVFHNYALEGAALDHIHASYDPSKGNFLSFDVQQDFRAPFALWTHRFAKSNVAGTPLEEYSRGRGWRMAVLLNDQVISAPTLDSPLEESAMISGNFSQREVSQLASDLKAGSFTFTPHILSEKNVDAQLGQKDRMQGIAATCLAFILVMGAMISYYRFAGCVASLAVLFNLLILWAVLQNLGAALTLSGIAGIILTVSMSVDANVLVFERMKEEYAKSNHLAYAIAAGYRKAYSAIIDSNITTLIAALILLQFEAGPLKSFAMNLIIGIVSSMFTALFVTQVYFESWVARKERKPFSMAHWMQNTQFDFIKRAKVACIVTCMLIALGTSLAITHHKTLWGMDFTGGFTADLELAQDTSPETILQAFTAVGVPAADIQVHRLGTPQHVRLFVAQSALDSGPSFAWVIDTLRASAIALAPHTHADATQWTSISGQISDSMQRQALLGLGLALICCFLYIALRFETPFAMAAMLCVLHDLCITLAAIGLLHGIGLPVQIDLNTIAALMTILGYSLNDTIIIFDRIREERTVLTPRVVNAAINSTLSRTTITSGTTLLALFSLALFGSGSIFSFACVMIVGVILGTLSSWFIATPLLLLFQKKEHSLSS